MHTSFSYWISSMALELPRSCITDSACFRSSSRFIVLYTYKIRECYKVCENTQLLWHIWRNDCMQMLKQEFSVNLLPVKAWSDTAVLWVRLVNLWVCVEQALHGAIAVKRRHVEEHLPRVKREEEWTRREKIRGIKSTEQTDSGEVQDHVSEKRIMKHLQYQVLPSSVSQVGMFPVMITSGSCNCLLAFAVSLLLINSPVGMISLHAAFWGKERWK